MTPSPMSRIRFVATWMFPIVFVAGGFFLAIPWLRTLSDGAIIAVAAGAAVFVMGWSIYWSVRCDRAQDEVQRAGSRFAGQWGALAGSVLTVLLTLSPWFLGFVVQTARRATTGSQSEDTAIELAFTLGFITLVVAQAVGTMIFNVGWRISKR